MDRIEFLSYTNRPPYREMLACLALEEGINRFELLERLIGRSIGTTIEHLELDLEELEESGLIASVNDCYLFRENWLKEMVLFLDEFEETKNEIDICEALIQRKKQEKNSP